MCSVGYPERLGFNLVSRSRYRKANMALKKERKKNRMSHFEELCVLYGGL
jgi:hypothetical protein